MFIRVALLASLAIAVGPARAAPPLPLRAAVAVVDGGGTSAALRDDVGETVMIAIQRAGCFQEVVRRSDDDRAQVDVVLTVGDVKRETRYARSYAERAAPQDVDTTLDLDAIFGVSASVVVAWREPGDPVRTKRIRAERSYRPMLHSEDPEQVVYDRTVEALSRQASRIVCGARRALTRPVSGSTTR